MTRRLIALLRTAYQAALTAVLVLSIALLPTCMIGGLPYRMDMIPSGQLNTELGIGSDERFAHVSVPEPGEGGGAEFFGEEKKLVGEPEITPVRHEAEPIGTAAARAAAERTYPVRDRRSGGPAVGRGVGPPGRTYTRDDGSERERRVARIEAERRANRDCDERLPGIRSLGGNRYAVSSAVVEHFTRDIGALKQIVGVRWYRSDDGRVEGFQVGNIRCGSPFTQVNILNGDVIHRINGKPVKSFMAAFQALRNVQRSQRVHVELSRRGDPQERHVLVE